MSRRGRRSASSRRVLRSFFGSSRAHYRPELGLWEMALGFMLLAAVASFAAFWYGIVDIWSRIGPAWGVIAAMTALALAFGFIVAGLYYGNDGADDEAERARQRYGLD